MIETFWNLCLLHDITSRDSLLREAVRVIRTKQTLEKQGQMDEAITAQPERLFQWMKEQVGDRELGHFPGDRDLFYRLYHAGKELNLLEYAVQTLQQDRTVGLVLVHPGLMDRFMELCDKRGYQSLFIAEAEKFLQGLIETNYSKRQFTITLLTENYIMGRLLKSYFESCPNVHVLQGAIYQPLPLEQKYDAILTLPHFGMKLNEVDEVPVRESEGAAVNHLLSLLEENGSLSVTFPARMMFQSGAIAKWRKQINDQVPVESIHILPDGLFRPYTSVKTYQVVFRKVPSKDVLLERLQIRKSKLSMEEEISLQREAFTALEDWRIDLLFDEDLDKLQSFQTAAVPKVKLREVADIFRGKSILKQDLRPGKIKVLNISNLDDGEVILDGLETIDEEERKVKRYELIPGDLVMTCRGTVNKLAVFPECGETVIASANILVIRFKQAIRSHYAKIFLESPVGTALIQSFQRGTTVMNLNPSDVAEIELPHLSEDKQIDIINRYLQEKVRYTDTIREAANRWQKEREQLYNDLY